MDERDWLAERFEENRSHLKAVAYRMLGRASDAEDAVQEAWIRLSRSDAGAIENLGGWLTTVVSRVCLDMLRSRKARREEALDPAAAPGEEERAGGPEDEVALADSVGMAMLVVLETLGPAERLAFVLHDMFGVPFEEIGPIVGRTEAAARQLASRARRRVHGAPASLDEADLGRQREVVEAFLAAARGGDFAGLLALLDPDVVLRVDKVAGRGEARVVRGAQAVAGGASRGGAREAQPALIDGQVGMVVAPLGQLMMVLRFTIQGRTIVAIEAVGEPERLAALELAVLDG